VSGTVSFQQIPQNLRLPLFYAEFNNSNANSAPQSQRGLIVGQLLGTAAVFPGLPVLVQGDGREQFGSDSMLARMVRTWRANDSFGELWALPVADPAAGVAATGTITVNAPATAAGTLSLYVADVLVPVAISPTQAVGDVANAIAAAITAAPYVPVTATAAAGVVTLTCVHKGAIGNDIDVRLNYQGAPGGEFVPAGLTINIAAMSGGTGVLAAELDDAYANLSDKAFDFIANPYTDATALTSGRTFMASRWAWNQQQYGEVFSAVRGTVGALNTFGAAQNDPHISFMGFNDSPSPVWAWAAAYAGASAVSLRADPGLPLQTVALNDVLAPPVQSRFASTDRNALLFDGISTFTVGDDNSVAIETAITSYQKDAYGDPDDSYLYVERLATLAYVVRYLRTAIQSTFGRCKLVDDGTNLRPGVAAVTPSVLKAFIVGRYRVLEGLGMVQDSAAFAKALVVQRNSANRCRIDGILPIVPVDQLRQVAALIAFQNSTG
jgi:phage tail sheath gpL-like